MANTRARGRGARGRGRPLRGVRGLGRGRGVSLDAPRDDTVDTSVEGEPLDRSHETSSNVRDGVADSVNVSQPHQQGEPTTIELLRALVQSRAHSGLTDFVKLVKPFNGRSTDPTQAEEWIESMEKTFDAMQVPDEQQVSYAAFLLEGPAGDWWKAAKRLLTPPISWVVFRDCFFQTYLQESFRDDMQAKYFQLKQGDMSVAEYEMKLHGYMKYVSASLQTDEKTKMTRFLVGLNSTLQGHVRTFELPTYPAMVNKAKLIEQRLKDEGQSNLGKRARDESSESGTKKLAWSGSSGGRGTFSSYSASQDRRYTPFSGANVEPNKGALCERCGNPHELGKCRWELGLCFECGEPGHYVSNCPKRPTVTCYNCGEIGHKQKYCRQPRGRYGSAQMAMPAGSFQASRPAASGQGSSRVSGRGRGQTTQTHGRVFSLAGRDDQVSNTVVQDKQE